MITTGWTRTLALGLLLAAGCQQDSESSEGASGQAASAGQAGAGTSGHAGAETSGHPAGGTGQAGEGGAGAAGQAGEAGQGGVAGQGGGLTSVPFEPAPWNSPGCQLPLRVARAGEEVGALYEREGAFWLQRLSSSGQRLGEAVALGAVSTPYGGAHASLASDGQRYVACWDTASPAGQKQTFRASCVAAPAGGGAVTGLLSEDGSGPTVAAGSHGVAVAYRTPDGAIVVRYLDPDSGVSPRVLPVDKPESSFQSAPRALLAATAGGFAVVTPAAARLHRLDHGLAVVAGPLELDPHPRLDWSGRPSIVGLGDAVAVSLRRPYGNDLFVVDEHDQVSPAVHYDGGGKLGTDVALVAEASTIGVLWRKVDDGEWRLLHESFAPAAAPVHKFSSTEEIPWSQGSSEPACALAVAALPGGASLVVTPDASGVAGRRLE